MRTFWLRFGEGLVRKGRGGCIDEYTDNTFLSPTTVADILLRVDPWHYDEKDGGLSDFVGIPFFMPDTDWVITHTESGIYDNAFERIAANDLDDFIRRLLTQPDFYREDYRAEQARKAEGPLTVTVEVWEELPNGLAIRGTARFSNGFHRDWTRWPVGDLSVRIWDAVGHDITTPELSALVSAAIEQAPSPNKAHLVVWETLPNGFPIRGCVNFSLLHDRSFPFYRWTRWPVGDCGFRLLNWEDEDVTQPYLVALMLRSPDLREAESKMTRAEPPQDIPAS